MIIRETAAAIYVTDDEEKKVWLPKSQIEYEGEPGDTVTIEMPEWLATDKELF